MTDKGCMYDHPMTFCTECGTWMNCKRDGIDLEYRRRPDGDEPPQSWIRRLIDFCKKWRIA